MQLNGRHKTDNPVAPCKPFVTATAPSLSMMRVGEAPNPIRARAASGPLQCQEGLWLEFQRLTLMWFIFIW
ncbi:hypothetical protein ACHAWF_010470, partial [Thalassiosira exigua]